jgi:hypothetical protein
MKTIVLTAILAAAYCSSFSQSLGPQVLNSTGGTFKKGYYVLDWSVGEPALIDQFSAPEGSFIITNGYIQSFTDLPDRRYIANIFAKDEIRILPNPTQGMLEVNFLTHTKGQVKLVISDAAGIIVLTREFPVSGYGRFERIDMSHLQNGTYFLRLELKAIPGFIDKKGVYKIIKYK